MRAAVIDIGSNTIKLVIGEDVDGEIKILETLKNVIDIGRSTFYKGRISQVIFNQIIEVLLKYKKVIDQYEVNEYKIIATTAVREAENRDIFLDTVRRKTGYDIEVLNVGDVVYYIDAFLSYKLKKAYPIHEKNLLIAELGAGSLDLSLMERGFSMVNLGIPIGTLRLKQFKNRIDGSHREIYEAIDEYVENQVLSVKKAFGDIAIDDVILIDESYSKALQTIIPNESRDSSFFPFKYSESEEFVEALTNQNLDDLAHKYDIPSDISDTIDGYGIIVNKLFKLLKSRSIYILETSLSEALLANIIFDVELKKKYNKTNQLVSAAKFLCQKFGSDTRHNKHVASLSEQLFDGLKDVMGLEEDDKLYLTLAALLHNIGSYISNRAHHKHTEYIINGLSLFRLTDSEIKMIACIARYHRRAIPQKTHYVFSSLNSNQQILVQKLSSILRIANALDGSHKQKVKRTEITTNSKGELVLNVYCKETFVLEKYSFQNMKSLFEQISGNKISLVVKKEV